MNIRIHFQCDTNCRFQRKFPFAKSALAYLCLSPLLSNQGHYFLLHLLDEKHLISICMHLIFIATEHLLQLLAIFPLRFTCFYYYFFANLAIAYSL